MVESERRSDSKNPFVLSLRCVRHTLTPADVGVKMPVVSENSDQAIALSQVQWALHELAANLMRITRGAGTQAKRLLEVAAAYRDVVGHLPGSDELAGAIRLARDREFCPG